MEQPKRILLEEGPAAGALTRTSVSHIAFRVPDVRAAEDFYGRVLGLVRHADLADGGVRLGWGAGHHVVDLLPGAKALVHFGFEVRDEGGLEQLRERLLAAGYPVADLDPAFLAESVGPAAGIATQDPDGNTVHFHGAVHRQGEHAGSTSQRPIKFQHTTLGTGDVAREVAFYVDVVGFRLTDQLEDGNFAWLRSDRDHHTLAIVDVGAGGDIDHYSFDLSEWEDFKSWCDRLTEQHVDVAWGPGRHGPGGNLFVFFDDPAGNHIELSAEMEKFYDDRATYAPRRWQPVPASINLWGGQLPKWRTTSGTR